MVLQVAARVSCAMSLCLGDITDEFRYGRVVNDDREVIGFAE